MAEERSMGTQWHGLNRTTAPHLLPENESPDTTDCAIVGEDHILESSPDFVMACAGKVQRGVLGQRNPRIRGTVRPYMVLGAFALNLPWGRQTLVAQEDGTWTSIANPWTNPAGPLPLNGWDRIEITSLAASRTGVGVTNGTAKTLSTAVELGNYGIFTLGDNAGYAADMAMTETGVVTDGTITLQGNIGGVWTDLYSWRYQTSGLVDTTQLMSSGTGSLTQVRLKSEVVTGAGTLAGTLNAQLFLDYGIEQSAISVS